MRAGRRRAMLGPEGFATCDACVGQRLEELEVAIEELLDRSPAQPLASAKAGDQLEHLCLAQWEVEREGPGDTRRWVGGWVGRWGVRPCVALATSKPWTAKGRWEVRRWVVALRLVGLGLVLDGALQRRSPGLVHGELLGDGLHKHAELDHALLLLVLQPVGDCRRPLSKHVQPPGKSSPMPLQISHGGLLARRQRMRSMSCPCGRHRERFVSVAASTACQQPSLPQGQ